MNIMRDPRWGRNQETFGECPYLSGQLADAFVRGLQGGKTEKTSSRHSTVFFRSSSLCACQCWLQAF